jgi:CheY-like chemotaxis protein
MSTSYRVDFYSPTLPKPTFCLSSHHGCSAKNTPKPRVLLVEDNPLIQKFEIALLKEMNCIVIVAGTGQEALDAFHSYYDLIFLDIDLPDMSGLAVATALRHQKIGAHKIPIIALTAQETDITFSCLAAGMNEVIAKPLTLKSLKAVLGRYLPHFSPLSSSY